MRLGIVYHRPFFQDQDGGLWEAEGSFSRFVEAMARHVDEVALCVPRRREPFPGAAYRLRAKNVRFVPLPFFDRLPLFYAGLPRMLATLWRQMPDWDLVTLRIPTPLGIYAFLLAGLLRRTTFLIVVGDLAGVSQSVQVNSLKRLAYVAYLAVEERLQELMVSTTPSFVNGGALYEKYNRDGRRILLTTTSTISRADVRSIADLDGAGNRGGETGRARLLCVSRVDPRKGLRFLPGALADLVQSGHDVELTIVGPVVGRLGAEERSKVTTAAAALGIADRVGFVGPKTLPEVLAIAREHDVFVLPTLPGEGVPRVLLEAMAVGLPIVASDVAGVPTLIADGVNGLLVPPADYRAIAEAVARLLRDRELRRQLIVNGFTVARAHTTDAHANKIVLGLRKLAGIDLRPTRVGTPAERTG